MPERQRKTAAPVLTNDAMRWLNTAEVARLLRIRPRTVYHLVSRGEIPHARARGKLLFDREQIEHWIAAQSAGAIEPAGSEPPSTLAGSHDPLLEWAVRESRCGFALATLGSVDGLDRFVARSACAALIHIPNQHDDGFNDEILQRRAATLPAVALTWAHREQGLMLAKGNPLRIQSLQDLIKKRARFSMRQPGAGSYLLLARLCQRAGLGISRLRPTGPLASSETDVAQAVAEGFADAGFGIRAAARQFGLHFVPLVWERLDLAMWRRSAFEPPMQTLLAFCSSRRFAQQARLLSGYDLSSNRKVSFNA